MNSEGLTSPIVFCVRSSLCLVARLQLAFPPKTKPFVSSPVLRWDPQVSPSRPVFPFVIVSVLVISAFLALAAILPAVFRDASLIDSYILLAVGPPVGLFLL